MGSATQIIGLFIGWLAIGWVAAQAMAFSLRTVRHRLQWERNYERERAEFCRRVEATARVARATKTIPDWEGWRPFRVATVIDEAPDVKSFYLTPVDGQPLPPFLPGQYLTFRLPMPQKDAQVIRCYSLSDRPRQDYYRVTVKRIAAPGGRVDLPPGRASSFLHERVHVGDVLDVRSPAGTFFIDPLATEPIVLVGAGIGITPLVSMLEASILAARGREVYALFGFRHGGEHPFKTHLEKLAAAHPQIHLHIAYSQPRRSDLLFKDFNHHGRLTVARIREVLPSNNLQFYLCGPAALMESLIPALWDWGVPEAHVNFEVFGPASVKSTRQTSQQPAEACQVRFARSELSATWNGSLASLLEFGAAAGAVLPSGCRAGSCGECMIAIRSGTVATIKQAGIPVPAGHCLTCISVPKGDLVLEA
jgi:ferredoxin-NADP reductase